MKLFFKIRKEKNENCAIVINVKCFFFQETKGKK